MEKRRVCIVTVYNSENYGSFLQAKCLAIALRELGYDVTFYKRPSKGTSHSMKAMLTASAKQFVKRRFQSIGELWKRHRKFLKAQQCFKVIDEHSKAFQSVDCFVIGSDTLWNVEDKYFADKTGVYFGNAFGDKKVITYAVSSGNTPISMLAENPAIVGMMKDLDKISVRDRHTRAAVIQATGMDAPIVVDPTLLTTPDAPMETNEKYVLVYCFGRLEAEVIHEIKLFAKEKGLKVVSIGHRPWCESHTPDPDAILNCFHNAGYVFTNTFHGTVFSIITNKKFVAYTEQKIKVIELLEQCGLSERRCSTPHEIRHLYEQDINYGSVQGILETLRADSLTYLQRAIED